LKITLHHLVANLEAFLQFLGGNWPNQADDHKTLAFAFGPSFRIILLLGGLAGVWRALAEIKLVLEVQRMKLKEILADRDRSIETQILLLFGETEDQRKKVHEAIKLGAEQFIQDYLPILADRETTSRVKEHFEKGDI
jgi:hypothetical protein